VAVTGSESDVAIVLTILVVASVFTPLRRSLEAVVDRRFAGTVPRGAARAPVLPPVARTAPAHTTDQPGSTTAVRRVHVAPVAADDSVPCPLGSGRRVGDCLRCPYLTGIGDVADLTIVCEPPLPA
jgi:hypothetical protein